MEIEMTWVEEYSVINWDNFKPLSLEHPKTFFFTLSNMVDKYPRPPKELAKPMRSSDVKINSQSND